MKKIYLLTLVLLTITHAHSQSLSTVTGHVQDREGEPLAGALVVLLDNDGELISDHFTDSAGYYTARIDRNADMTVNISCIGYEPRIVEFRAGDQTDDCFFAVLDRVLSVDVEGVTVTMERPKLHREGNRFVLDNISASLYARGVNVHTLLGHLPLIDTRKDEISLLGKGQASIFINGRDSHMTSDALDAYLKSVPAESIERIEIILNPGSEYRASYGGGIINIIMKKRLDEGVRFTLGLSDVQDATNSQFVNGTLDATKGRFNITSGIFANNYTNFDKREDFYDYHSSRYTMEQHSSENASNRTGGANINIDYNINDKQVVGARASTYGGFYNSTSWSRSAYTNYDSSLPDSIEVSRLRFKQPFTLTNYTLNLNYNLQTDDNGSKFTVDFDYIRRLGRGDHRVNYTTEYPGGTLPQGQNFLQQPHSTTDLYSAKIVHTQKLGSDNVLKAGLEFNAGRYDSDFRYANFRNNEYIDDPRQTNRFVFNDYTGSAFVAFERSWSDKISTEIGVRLETYHGKGEQRTDGTDVSKSYTDIFPNVTINYEINDEHEISVDFGTGINRPSYVTYNTFKRYTSANTYYRNNPDLKPSRYYELSFNYMFFDDFYLMGDYTHYDNLTTMSLIVDENGENAWQYMNFGKNDWLYATIGADVDLFDDRLNLDASVSMDCDRYTGWIGDNRIDETSVTFDFDIAAAVTLSKKQRLIFTVNYWYYQPYRYMGVKNSGGSNMYVRLSKNFDNGSISLQASNFINRNYETTYVSDAYSYRIKKNQYPSVYLNFYYTFGNNRVRKAYDRQSPSSQSRLEATSAR